MWRATWKSLLAHKLRLALTALAVVLGVAFMSGTFVLTDTIKHTFSNLFTQAASGESAVVRAVAPYGNGRSGGGQGLNGDRPLTPDSLVSTVQAIPGVGAADGSVSGYGTMLNLQGKTFTKGAPTVILSYNGGGHLSPLRLHGGHFPTGPDQVAIDVSTVSKEHFALGDQITVIGNNGPGRYTLVGSVSYGSSNNLAGASLAAFELDTAQRVIGKPGFVNQIDVAATSGESTAALVTAIGSHLPNGFEVITAQEAAAENAANVSQALNGFNTFLLVFAGIALFVGAFLIFNTFSILVGQRTRELALMRAIGASRRQINASVLGEAAFTGLFGSAVGLLVGIGLAAGIYALLDSLGVSLPKSALQFEARTAIVGLIVGTAVTLVSAVLPALRAGSIPPAAGLREDAVVQDSSLRRRSVIGGGVLVVGIVVLAIGLFGSSSIQVIGLGAALTFIGVAMLTPFVVPPMVAVLGRPLPAVAGITGQIGKENAARNPRRTAATSSALMIGIALVAAIATLGQSANASFNSIFDKAVSANYVLVPNDADSLPPAVANAVRNVPGVTAVSGVSDEVFHLDHASEHVTGLDPVGGPQVLHLDMTAGSVSALGQNQILVESDTAKSNHYQIGQTLNLGFAATGVVPVRIGGFYKTNTYLDTYVLSGQFLDAHVNQPSDFAVGLRTTDMSAATTAALKAAVASYGDIKVDTAAQFESDQKNQLKTILTVVYALLALSIIIALIGVVNTLALSVMERTREIGLLRAVGTQRRQLKRMIRAESLIVALIGAILGLILGVGLGAAVVSAVGSSFVTELAVPVPTIIVVLILAAFFGMFASVWPARRAAKMDVLEAIYTV
ncbi:MAG TPA: ABC transporter permease [Acidimicrobiales bacterium]|jgi:putative ABC transport system permease protein|nr:ABC transporter permease [Acidimicrobiales bacterium]